MIQLQPPRSKDIEGTESKPESSKLKKQLATFLTRYISFQGASRGKNIAVTNTVSLPARMHQVSDLRMNGFI